MTTGFSQVTALDAAAFDTLIGQAVRGRSATLSATASGTASAVAPELPEAVTVAPAPAPDVVRADTARATARARSLDSMPDAAAFARQMGRSFRTASPLLVA